MMDFSTLEFTMDSNSWLWFFSVFVQFGFVLLAYKLFGKVGLFAYMGITILVLNLVTVKLVEYGMFGGLVLGVGAALHGTTFLTTDILNENYGKKEARKALWLGITFAGFAVLLLQLALQFEPAGIDFMHDHMVAVFGFATRIVIASLTAFLVSGLIDIWLFRKFRDKENSKLWVSNNISTWIGKTVDVVLFIFLAFYGILPLEVMIAMIPITYAIDIATTMIDTPYVYVARWLKDKNKVGVLNFRENQSEQQ